VTGSLSTESKTLFAGQDADQIRRFWGKAALADLEGDGVAVLRQRISA
jgi:hypothetical protein